MSGSVRGITGQVADARWAYAVAAWVTWHEKEGRRRRCRAWARPAGERALRARLRTGSGKPRGTAWC
jgi:hypothetical protein